tara:strand:+ start:1320 stop:2210 length:891 start_codon:yes stop_codon:yes gene_type:complete
MHNLYGKEMKITIIGGGAIGLVLAASLENKSEVSVLVKPEKFKKLSEKGLWIVENNIKRRINAKVVNDMKEPDIVIIAVKGYDLEKTNELLNDFKGKLIICQNGLKMLDFNPPNNNEIFAIVTSIGAESLEEGITEFKGTGNTLLGNLHNVINDSKDMLNLFSTKYFKISHKTNIKNYIWLKAVINSAINPIASHHGIKNGELKKEKYWESVRELLSESVNIAKSNDINFAEEPIKLTEEIIEMTANNICSMLQDITKGRKTEINEINGALIQIGKKNDVSTRLNSEYLEKIKVLN